jgi:hypothetical protein
VTRAEPPRSTTKTNAMDELHGHLFIVLMDREWKHSVEAAVDVTLLGRFYERFADHAVEIGRRVIFQTIGRTWSRRFLAAWPRTSAGVAATPTRCPRGHPLRVDRTIVRAIPCACGRHTFWRCHCGAVTYGPPLGDGCSLLDGPARVR